MIPTIKNYIIARFEQVFVLVVLVSIALINYYIPYKIAFLNFYYIPILFAAYYLGRLNTLYGTILCIFLVIIFAYRSPESFLPGSTQLDIFFNISTWACFLLLVGIILGTVQEKLQNEYQQTLKLNEELDQKEIKLERANKELEEYSKNLETKVKERTEDLEKSKLTVENLKKKVEEALYSTMDQAVVKLMIEGRLRNEKKEISVLFSDLKGFTTYSEEMRPEVVVGDLNKYLEEMETILLNYRGHIDKYMGDGILAEFGAPIDYETHALQAVLAGLKMQERLRNGHFPWEMRVGVATGEAITGLIGHKRQTYTAIGSVVNQASRVEENCTPGIVTIDEDTYKEVKTFFITQRKLYVSKDHLLDEKTMQQIEELHHTLEADPLNLEVNKALGFIYQNIKDLPMAIEYFKNALDLAPDDDHIKVAFAETSLEMETQGNIPIRGKKKAYHLYEVKGLRDPLEDREKIPQRLYDRYSKVINKLVEYPEGIVLPVEALDGSIGHSKGMGFLSYALADNMGIPGKEKEDILLAGYLCDIGKEIVPQHLLNRAGSLTKSEFEEIIKHAEESIRILKKMGYETEHVFEIIEAHHEKLNGTGYPMGLKGDEIPLGSRIVAVADMYDALTSWRPYRERWDHRAAFSEIQKERKLGNLDREVVDHLGRLLELEVT